ncbi:hypothetical protein [Sulfobacillus harzensis]|uniref:Uncharacterized protein n=1 Tax=Sulfobacillus harzensis TaxID=2729629 RepID=A0A7Y0Q242_9FIRM|nr:hypothetical protein [Sulfobacillus harzensis]NMP20779.1 hypothetical protein [Sulfobacillus harzensis]
MAIVKQYRVQVDVQAWTPQGKYYHQDLMGDLKTIQTSKTTSQPYGTFTLTFTLREDQGGSWADKLVYRTYVEIRAGIGSGKPPILMRGFVDAPGQQMQMPGYPAGPQREVTVSGRDMGAILADWQILYLWGIDPMATFFAANIPGGSDALIAQLGLNVAQTNPNKLLSAFIEKLVNGPTTSASNPAQGAVTGLRQVIPAVPYFIPKLTIPDAYQINFLSLQPWQGAYSNFLDYFASPPWGEDFVLDEEDGPWIVVRQTPYKNYETGQYPLRYNGTPEELGFFPDIIVDAGDVTAHDITINGANQLYTYYSTTPDLSSVTAQSYAQFFYVYQGSSTQAQIITPSQAQADQGNANDHVFAATGGSSATGAPLQTNPAQASQPGSNPYFDPRAKYIGIRPLQLTTPWVSTLQATFGPDAQKQVADLNTWLVNVFAANDRFSSGTITCHGFPAAKVGRYVVVSPGTITSDPNPWEAYIQSVSHEIDLYSNNATWTMDLGVIRGRVRS